MGPIMLSFFPEPPRWVRERFEVRVGVATQMGKTSVVRVCMCAWGVGFRPSV